MEKNIVVSFKGWNKKITFQSNLYETDSSFIKRKIKEMLYTDTTLQQLLGRNEFVLQQYDYTVDSMTNIDDEPIHDKAKVCISLIEMDNSTGAPQPPPYSAPKPPTPFSNYTSFRNDSFPPAAEFQEPMNKPKINGTKVTSLPEGEERTNLIINYLPQAMTDEDLSAMFVTVGPLARAKIIRDNKTGYSFGFGFVEYMTPVDAHRAIFQLNGLQVQHKQIKVSYARPSGEDIKGTNLYIINLPKNITLDVLNRMFEGFGTIVQSYLPKDWNTGLPKGNGFVRFDKKEQAEAALKRMNGFTPEGGVEPLVVRMAEDRGRTNQSHFIEDVGHMGYHMRPRMMRPMGPPGMRPPHMRPRFSMRSLRPTNRYNPMRGASHM